MVPKFFTKCTKNFSFVLILLPTAFIAYVVRHKSLPLLHSHHCLHPKKKRPRLMDRVRSDKMCISSNRIFVLLRATMWAVFRCLLKTMASTPYYAIYFIIDVYSCFIQFLKKKISLTLLFKKVKNIRSY